MRLTLLLSGFIGSAFLANAQLLPQQPAPLHTHMLEVNAEWEHQADPADADAAFVSFRSEADRIAQHLRLAREKLAQHAPEGSTADQLQARQELLGKLGAYADRGLFPQNKVLPYRNPVFIDPLGTACAVGQLMIESGHRDLAEHISSGLNLGYVREIIADPRYSLPVSQWAHEHGFEADELAWIQPAYPPPTVWTPLGEGTNGDVRVIHDLGNGELLIAGAFTQAGGVAASSVAVWANGQYTTLGAGVPGEVSCVIEHGGMLYVGGQFQGASQDLAMWDGTSWTYEAVFSSKAPRITALHVHEGELFAAGELMGFAGADHAVKRKLGNAWDQVGEMFNGEVLALGTHDGALVVGGAFTGPDGQTDPVYAHVAVLNNMSWTPLGDGLNAPVRALLDVDGTLYAGGDLFVNIAITFGLARIPSSGSSWEELLPDHGNYMYTGLGSTYIGSLARKGDELVVGGQFVIGAVVGVYGTNVALWLGGPDLIEPLAGYLDGAVQSLHVDGNLLIMGGAFAATLPHIASTDLATGIHEHLQQLPLVAYPNPAQDMIRITLPDQTERPDVTVFDAQGRRVIVPVRYGSSSTELDINGLASGSYQVQVTDPDGIRRASFVKP